MSWFLLLAQGQATNAVQQLLIPGAVLIIAIIALAIIVKIVRDQTIADTNDSADEILDDLASAKDAGELSAEEYKAVREAMKRAQQKALAGTDSEGPGGLPRLPEQKSLEARRDPDADDPDDLDDLNDHKNPYASPRPQ